MILPLRATHDTFVLAGRTVEGHLSESIVQSSRIGNLFLGLGVLVGGAAGVGMLAGFEPSSLPPALLDIAAYKLTFVGAFGLLAAGAVMRRYARREESRNESSPPESPPAPPRELGAGDALVDGRASVRGDRERDHA